MLRALPLTLLLVSTAARAESGLWAWSVKAVGQIVDGDVAGAVRSVAEARRAKPLPELDALVGVAALEGGQRAAARRQLQAAIQHGSTEPLVFYWAARAAWAEGQTALARRLMEQAVAVGGDRPLLRMGQALVLLAPPAQEARAAAALLAVAAREPNLLDPSLYPTPLEGAVDLLEPLLRRFPGRGQLLRTQGHLLWRAGRVLAALRRFQALLSQAKGDPDALQMLARGQVALGQRATARAAINRALEAAPGSPQALAARGELLLDEGQAGKAAVDLQRAADGLPRDARLLSRAAQACAEAEKPICARRFFTYALLRDPQLAAAHFGLALLDQQSSPAESRARFQRAIALDPGHARYYQAAAHLAGLQHDARAAVELLAEARQVAPTEQRHARRIEVTRRWTQAQSAALEHLTRDPSCAKVCRASVGRVPEPARGFMLAHLALRQGRRVEALQLLAPLVKQLKAARLLTRDATLVETKGKTTKGQAFSLRSVLPLVPVDLFR
jgi:tetratricopeptide (TPR) repeat protein